MPTACAICWKKSSRNLRGDICLGPAAGDMVGCAAWFGQEFFDQIFLHYTGPVTRADMPWIIERGVLVALSNINYGEQSARSDYFRLGMHMLDQLLPKLK
jgi:hypothetical protein